MKDPTIIQPKPSNGVIPDKLPSYDSVLWDLDTLGCSVEDDQDDEDNKDKDKKDKKDDKDHYDDYENYKNNQKCGRN